MKSIKGKIVATTAALLIAAQAAMPFTMAEFYNKLVEKFPTAQQTDSLKTKQYEYDRNGNFQEMNQCIMVNADSEPEMVFQAGYISFADDSTAALQDSATYENSLYFKAIDTSANLDSAVSEVEKDLKGIEDVVNGIGIEQPAQNPEYGLTAAPNPANPSTNVIFDLDNAGDVKIGVYDTKGRMIENLVNGKLDAGRYTVGWNANDLSSGTYLVRMETDKGVQTQRINLVR